MPFGFGSTSLPISRRKALARREVARTERTRALAMALLHYEANHPLTSEAWLSEAEYWESQLEEPTAQ